MASVTLNDGVPTGPTWNSYLVLMSGCGMHFWKPLFWKEINASQRIALYFLNSLKYSFSMAYRLIGLAKDILVLGYFLAASLVQNDYRAKTLIKLKVVGGSFAEVLSSGVGIVCPPIAYYFDELLMQDRDLLKHQSILLVEWDSCPPKGSDHDVKMAQFAFNFRNVLSYHRRLDLRISPQNHYAYVFGIYLYDLICIKQMEPERAIVEATFRSKGMFSQFYLNAIDRIKNLCLEQGSFARALTCKFITQEPVALQNDCFKEFLGFLSQMGEEAIKPQFWNL